MRSVFKYKIKKFIPVRVWENLAKIKNKSSEKFFEEYQISGGSKNSEIEILVIRRKPPGAGMFSNINHVLQGLIYAESKSKIPIVDMQNYAVDFSQIRKFNNTRNAWEYFFKQTSNLQIEEAYESKNVTISKGDRILNNHVMSGRNLAWVYDQGLLNEAHKIYTKYIKLNEYSQSYINYIFESKDICKETTLGVFLRGSGYDKDNKGHPIQPPLGKVIEDIKNYMLQYPVTKIFLATEDSLIREKIKFSFGDSLIKNVRSDTDDEFAHHLRKKFLIPNHAIARNLSYLSEIYILADLSFNIASLTNGSAMLYVIKGGKFKLSNLYFYGIQ